MVTVALLPHEDLASLDVGDVLYDVHAEGWATRWHVTAPPMANGFVRVADDRGATSGVTPWTAPRWYAEHPDGVEVRVHEVAGHVVQLRVVVPLGEASTKSEALAVAQELCGEQVTAWAAQPYTDRVWHLFDESGWLLAEALGDEHLGPFGGVDVAGTVLYRGEMPVRDCHRHLMARIAQAQVPRPGPDPDPDARVAVIDGLARGLSFAQIAARLGVSRQRANTIAKSLRSEAAAFDFADAAPTSAAIHLARFVTVDLDSSPERVALAQAFLDRAGALAAPG